MKNIVFFLEKNTITMFVVTALIATVFVFISRKKSGLKKVENSKHLCFSQHEYDEYEDIDEKVLNNTVITFIANEEKSNTNFLYNRSISTGETLLQNENFQLTNVGVIE